MERRRFLAAVALAALPGGLQAQRRREIPVVGALYEQPLPNDFSRAFADGIQELGHVQGEDLRIDQRSARGVAARLPALAAELVRRKPSIIFAAGDEAARAAVHAARTVPVVFAAVTDGTVQALVRNPRQPEGNVTGVAPLESRVHAKRLELVRELVPRLQRLAVFFDSTLSPAELAPLQQAALAQRTALQIIAGRNAEELRIALNADEKRAPQALLVLPSPLFSGFRQAIVGLAKSGRLPALYPDRSFVEAGGLVAYAPDVPGMCRPAARLVLSLLQGAKVANLPVEQAKFELTVNLRAAKVERFSVPRSMIARADRILQ
jgi:putative ABC transport system substrate-binding protein